MEVSPVRAVVSTALIVVSAIFPVLSLMAIVIRYMARQTARLSLQADDWWILASWATFGLSVNAWVFGSITGIDHYKIDPALGVSRSLQCLLVSSLILQVSLSVVKISILFLYMRIFATRKFRTAAWIAIYVIGGWGIMFFFLVLFEGDPISAAWTGIGRFRYDTVAIGESQVGTSIALDFIVLMFPLPVIWRLHMPTRRKIAVALIFWLGALQVHRPALWLVKRTYTDCLDQLLCRGHCPTGASEIVSFPGSHRWLHATQSRQFIFMILEPNCSIIAACLPCYGPLLARGRAPESLIRSVRSVFTLRSRDNSIWSSMASRTNNSTGPNKTSTPRESGSAVDLVDYGASWSKGRNESYQTARCSSSPDIEEIIEPSSQGIQVTTKVDVSSKRS
ncbi:hypothetical protein AN3257.2 [Aspergillus nidulans FGSC A4]|uniref:Rhodopsin domain-containing protein n=1 Tax=Emericella nidulans (strain FGSC A4 / ATCC 38163 / CBS 112.46 / NRRL 194 / M139) TaxID=227321 RepID=Q5B873_EMENI|nr:hypothetical protein [Aspergillus nidulans FGSC A4]EAA63158.1 hypothetical protein AN3257.2 [Aspergillus nidulans FGSC A4]CBF83087.1 TPA: conserved hypothetical protein [Aspergillus nidulans FGSC A4]|eukprot:XP_660861.1 hypothetical protein AN3257.2 [Aspergillus nidulans FGSC A4]